MRIEGVRPVLSAAAGGCAALVLLALLRPNDATPPLRTTTPAGPAIRGDRVSAAAAPESLRATAPTAERVAVSPVRDLSSSGPAAEPVLDGAAEPAAQQREWALQAARVESGATIPGESGERDSTGADDHALPSCWIAISNLPQMYYAVARDERQVWSGSSSARFFAFDDRAQHGSLLQTVRAAAFAGKRLEFSAHLQTESATLGVMVWLIAVDAAGRIVAERGTGWLRGTLGWHRQAIVADIPAEAAAITLGFRVLGTGTLWVDDAALAAVERAAGAAAAGAVTPNGGLWPNPKSTLPLAPQNLDFEDWQGKAACEGPPAG